MSSNIIIRFETKADRDNCVLVMRTALERHIDRLATEPDIIDVEYKTVDNDEACELLEGVVSTIDYYFERD